MEVGGTVLGVPAWQGVSLCGILVWIAASSALDLTRRARSLLQPWVSRRVASDTPFILAIQSVHHVLLDTLFSALSCIVSVPFYTAVLPPLFWTGHSKLGRQLILLMAFCDYVGNSIKDLVSAPRPTCPPVKRVTATKDEKENAKEYGLPSAHVLNTVCLFGYLLHYVISNSPQQDAATFSVGFILVFLLVVLMSLGRIYLGMHSLIDVLTGIGFGVVILAFWLAVHGYVDNFIISGQNVTPFWAGLSFLLCFAYPTPEFPTPSFEYHTAFNGVVFGVVSGCQQARLHLHNEEIRRLLSPDLTFPVVIGRILVGLSTILTVKFCCKTLAKWVLPVACDTLGIPIRSSCYVPQLNSLENSKNKPKNRRSGYLQKLLALIPQESYDVDTSIRFIQHAGAGWSALGLVPSLLSRLRL